MKLFETTEGYLNILQDGNISWEMTLIRIEDELEQIKAKYNLGEDDVLIEIDSYNQQGFDVFVIGLNPIINELNAYEEFILFLSNFFKIDIESLKKLDYLNLRRF